MSILHYSRLNAQLDALPSETSRLTLSSERVNGVCKEGKPFFKRGLTQKGGKDDQD